MYTFNTLWIRYGYVHSITDVDFSDTIRWEVGRSWTLTIFELFFVYVGIRSGHTPWCDRAFTQCVFNQQCGDMFGLAGLHFEVHVCVKDQSAI